MTLLIGAPGAVSYLRKPDGTVERTCVSTTAHHPFVAFDATGRWRCIKDDPGLRWETTAPPSNLELPAPPARVLADAVRACRENLWGGPKDLRADVGFCRGEECAVRVTNGGMTCMTWHMPTRTRPTVFAMFPGERGFSMQPQTLEWLTDGIHVCGDDNSHGSCSDERLFLVGPPGIGIGRPPRPGEMAQVFRTPTFSAADATWGPYGWIDADKLEDVSFGPFVWKGPEDAAMRSRIAVFDSMRGPPELMVQAQIVDDDFNPAGCRSPSSGCDHLEWIIGERMLALIPMAGGQVKVEEWRDELNREVQRPIASPDCHWAKGPSIVAAPPRSPHGASAQASLPSWRVECIIPQSARPEPLDGAVSTFRYSDGDHGVQHVVIGHSEPLRGPVMVPVPIGTGPCYLGNMGPEACQ